jgi:aspartyl-tRNA(Asn)/glutamyl-tRNA(Gln) amidotransferase subunit C
MNKEEEVPQKDGSLDTGMVEHVAALVRLGITEEEARAFSHQFSKIIDYFKLLNEVDTQAVLAANEIPVLRSVMREDEVEASMPREDFMENVPRREGSKVRVPPVFGEE